MHIPDIYFSIVPLSSICQTQISCIEQHHEILSFHAAWLQKRENRKCSVFGHVIVVWLLSMYFSEMHVVDVQSLRTHVKMVQFLDPLVGGLSSVA